MKKIKTTKGITLITLVITITILLILAGITLNVLWGEGGIINQAEKAKITNELATYKEQLDMFVKEKTIEDQTYEEESLTAGKTELQYNTKKEEGGNIKTVIPGISNEYLEKLEIIKGELLINTKDKREIEIAQSMGIEVNPYDITEEGELLSSNGNLLLMDRNGTITIPERVTKIGEGAFANVEGLKTIIIPSTVTIIETGAFRNNPTVETVIMQEKDGHGVEHIGAYAFMECPNLTTVQMPNTVKEMRSQAFYYCMNLRNINLSTGLDTIYNYTFAGCRNLTNVQLPEGIINVKDFAFGGCTNLETIEISSSVNSIAGTAFSNCNKLNNIKIDPENKSLELKNGILLGNDGKEMIIILEEAINNNTFTIPDTVATLRELQINRYNNIITTIEIPESVTSIEARFFPNSVTKVILLGDKPNYEIYNDAIYSKETADTDITMIRYYGSDATVNIKEGTKIIAQYCFNDKSLIKQINFPNSLEQISFLALNGCKSLKSITLGENVNQLDSTSIYGSGIEEIKLDANNQYYSIREGAICNGEKVNALYNKNGDIFISPIKVLGTIKTYEIPANTKEIINGQEVETKVTQIKQYAFHGQTKMDSIIIPNTVEKIEGSFNYCDSLLKIEIPNSVKEIYSSCFSNCINLKEIIIHNVEGSIKEQPWGCIYGDKAIHWVGK